MSGMVKVRVLQQMSGTRNGEPWPERGETMMVTPEEADQLALGQTPIAEVVPDEVVPSKKAPEGSGVDDPTTKKEDDAGKAETGAPAQAKPASSSTTRTASARQTGTAKK